VAGATGGTAAADIRARLRLALQQIQPSDSLSAAQFFAVLAHLRAQ